MLDTLRQSVCSKQDKKKQGEKTGTGKWDGIDGRRTNRSSHWPTGLLIFLQQTTPLEHFPPIWKQILPPGLNAKPIPQQHCVQKI